MVPTQISCFLLTVCKITIYQFSKSKVKLLGLPHMMETSPEPTLLPKSQDILSSPQLISVELKSTPWRGFQVGSAEADMEVKTNVKFGLVMTRINFEKFYHDLNEKLITVTNTLKDYPWEGNLSRRRIRRKQVIYVEESFQLKLSIMIKISFSSKIQYHVISLITFWASRIIVMLLQHLQKLFFSVMFFKK